MLFKGNFVLVPNYLSLTIYHAWIKKWSWSTFWEQDERSHWAFPIHKNLFFHFSTFPILTRTTLFGCVSHTRLVLKLRSYFVQKQPPDAFYINNVFLKTLQNLQGRTCARAFFLLKDRLWCKCIPGNSVKLFRTQFLQNTSGWLLLFVKKNV